MVTAVDKQDAVVGCFGAASDEALRAAPTSIFDNTGFHDPHKDAVKGRKLDSDRFPPATS